MKKLYAVCLILALVLGLCACASNQTSEKTTEETAKTETTAPQDESSQDEAKTDDKTDAGDKTLEPLVVGASSTPHAEILEQVKDDLAAAGYDLQIKIFDDYVLPNTALNDGELDANYFQHTPYLTSFNAANGTDLVAVASIHYEPFGLYGNGVEKLEDVQPGAKILIPADDSNETRALLLLQQEGLIQLPEDASAAKGVTTLDIVDDGGYEITAVQADAVASLLQSADAGTLAVVNGNYALQAGLDIQNALAVEDASGDAAKTYANVIAVRAEDAESDKTQALVQALQTEKVRTFLQQTYHGAVEPIF